jgi:3-hydroxyacyl-CoA dehydrogenase
LSFGKVLLGVLIVEKRLKVLMEPKTEDEIERWVEMMMDRLDMKYSVGRLTEEDYNEEVRKISKQADKYYDNL